MLARSKTHPTRDSLYPVAETIRKIAVLSNWRFQLLSQAVVADRAHRRPFKLTRGPLPFLATDMGSAQFTREEDDMNPTGALPLELRKRLSEIGWAQDDQPTDEKQECIHTPMSLLPSHQLSQQWGFFLPLHKLLLVLLR